MKPMRAKRASKWQLSLANGFALLRERYFEIDTIPKPRGLGSGGPRSGLSVRFCPAFVQLLSGFCPLLCSLMFDVPEGRWKTNFKTF